MVNNHCIYYHPNHTNSMTSVQLGFSYETTITKNNIDCFRSGVFTSQRITWKAGPLDADILGNFPKVMYLYCSSSGSTSLEGLRGCPLLKVLECNHNELTTIDGTQYCPQLERFDCMFNAITTLKGLECCPQLRDLECGCNKITSLIEIRACTKLRNLGCCANRIQSLDGIQGCRLLKTLSIYKNLLVSLEGIEGCVLLRSLCCYGNKIVSLQSLRTCTQLKELSCSNNELTSLEGIERCTVLGRLTCQQNQITSLAGMENCLQLNIIDCSNNCIQSLDQLIYLRHLQCILYAGNPIEVCAIQIQRCLERANNNSMGSSVYNDSQSAHNVHVQKTVCESVQRLVRDPEPDFTVEMIIESGMDERAIRLLLEYCDDESVHSVHLLSFKELLSYVWARICRSEHRTELIRILGEQILDAECKCFTGRFNRTVSVLVGFYPDIVIEISDSSRIGTIIIKARDQTVPYHLKKHRDLAHKLLLEAGYGDEEIRPWLEAISEP